MNTLLLFLISLTLCLLSQSQPIYIDQSISASSQQDGSQANPYSTLAAAFNAITETSAELVFIGQSYTVDKLEAYTTNDKKQTVITVKATKDFTLRFTEKGQISCSNYAQTIITPSIKNVNISFTGLNIETVSTLPLFTGTCYFSFEDILIEELRSPLLLMKTEGSALLRRFTINNIILGENQNLIDQDSRERIESDYLIFESVMMKNTNKQGSVTIRSFLQYKQIEVKDSMFEGITFSIKGEQIGGNNKTDIIVKNVTMMNAESFFFIESYGTVSMEDSTFINASNRAVYFFITDENLSPKLATFKNCVFSNNVVENAGGAMAFQGSKETSYQFSVNTVISGCQFTNNKAGFSGGALAFMFLRNADISIEDSEFSSNSAAESGGAIYINRGEPTLSMTVRNCLFQSNSAFSGGVYSFEFITGATITLENNTYIDNSARLEGGIGVVSQSVLTLKETNSTATDNHADFQGGSWYFETNSDVTFEKVQFKNSRAFLRGGCIANDGASLTLTQVSFANCALAAVSSLGGAVFIGEDATLKVSDSQFSDNLAELGAAVAIQSQKETPQVLDGITLTSNLRRLNDNAPTVKSQILQSGPGELTLKNVAIPDLQAPFLAQLAGKVNVQNVRLGKISCDSDDESLSFCVFGIQASGEEGQSFSIEDLRVESAVSSIPLLISQGSSVVIKSVVVDQMQLPGDIPVWDIKNSVFKAGKVELLNLNKNFVRLVNSDMDVEDSNFEYHGKGEGGLVSGPTETSGDYELVPKNR